MPSAPKVSLIVLAALVVVAIAALAAVNLVFDREEVRTHAIAGPVSWIVVRSGGGDVHLVRSAGQRVVVRETRHFVVKQPTLDRKLTDGVLTLDSHCRDAGILNCSADLRVTVPAGIDVSVQSGSGDVDADGIDVRHARLNAGSGDVRATLTGTQSAVWTHAGSGNVQLVAPGARAVDAQTGSGDVKVDALGRVRRLVVQAGSGDVEVNVPRGAYAIETETGSGDVDVDDALVRDDRAPRTIDARAGSGDVQVHAR